MEQLSCFLGFIVYLIGYSSSDVTYLGDGCNWKQAMQVCESKGGYLPDVPILINGFGQINNIQHENRCIWLKATYELTNNLADGSYPNRCCEVMFRDKNGTAQKDCVSCRGNNGYICASGSNTISLEYSKNVDDAPWWNADKYCRTRALRLPSDTNTDFLQYLPYMGVLWINGIRTLNTNPTKDEGMFPVCSCNGIVRQTCPSNSWTYCVLETENMGSLKLNIDAINISSTTVRNAPTLKNCSKGTMNAGRSESSSYFTTPLSTTSNVLKHSSGNFQASRDSSITATTKESMSTERYWTSYFTSPLSSSLNVSQTSTGNLQDVTALDSTQTTRADVTENGALIGGVAGTTVVVTMIIIIVVVFLLRRSKQAQNKNSNSQSPVNHNNLLKDRMEVDPSYDDLNGEVPNTCKHESIQIQHMEKELTTYVTATKVQGSNGFKINEKQLSTDVYSMVQKRPNKGHNLNYMNQNAVGDEEYDKINFDNSNQTQQAGDVYDKTNFRCEDREEILENDYNQAEFYHKHQNVDAGNVYDKPNFDGGQQNKHSANAQN